jgi:hypothetical protein
LDSDYEEAGIYSVEKGKIDKARSFPFMSELSNLYYLKIEKMSSTEFGKMSGWELWHRRLAPALFEISKNKFRILMGWKSC